MNMRLMLALIVVGAFATVGCAGNSDTSSPTQPTAVQTVTGTWVGTTTDSSGSMMGAGLTPAMMNSAQWTITQSGSMFSGTMKFPGYTGMMGTPMTITGTMTGHTGTFTMTMPAGSMMGSCSATASGTFDVDDMITQMHGTYSGMNSCSGAFDQGQMSFHR
jgi:hypothetical protein